MKTKVKSLGDLSEILVAQRQRGQRIVLTNGCFDLLHIGHTRYLQEARNLGDLLVVAVNTDASIRSLVKEGCRPIVPEDQRSEILAALVCVDFVVLFNEPDPLVIIKALHPDVLVKGGDWSVDQVIGRREVEAWGGTVRILPMVPNISTTTLIDRIRQDGGAGSDIQDPSVNQKASYGTSSS